MFNRKMRKFFPTIITLVLILVMACTTAIASTPSDTSSHWAKAKIEKWINQGLASGFEDGTFKPDKSISRAEFMAFTNNAFKYTEIEKIDYIDVPTGVWYEGVVAKAAAAGYLAGYPDGTMKPGAPITRQEVAAMISRIQNLSGNPGVALKCSDGAKISQWAKGAVGAVIEAGYMSGYPDGSFKPGQYVTRAEALVALDNVISKSIDQSTVVYEKAGLYGPEDDIEVIEKDIIIKADGVTLQNTRISGDLFITEEVGEGAVALNNVTVEGNTWVRGGGPNSIVINGGKYQVIIVENVNTKIRLVAKGVKGPDGNQVDIIISEDASGEEIIFEGDFDSIDIQADGLVVSTRGSTTINTVTIGKNVTGSKLKTNEGTNIENLVLDSPADVSGSGNIKNTKDNTKLSTGSGGGGGGGGGSSNSPPGRPDNLTPANGSGNIDYLSPVLSWTCSDPDGHSLTYDIYLGTDRSLVEKMAQPVQKATGYQGTAYPAGQLESVTKYYWKVVAKDGRGGETASPLWEFTTKTPEVKTNGIGYFKIENDDRTKYIEGFVTHYRGGPRVPGATVIYPKNIFEHSGDFLVTKDGYAATRIQNVYWKSVSDTVYGGDGSVSGAVYGWNNLNYVFEVPIGDPFNPAWTNTPPEFLIDGINPGDQVSGTIEFDVSFPSGKTFYVCYVYLGGEQRYPNEGVTLEEAQTIVSIDTTAYPNGPTYLKILAYDENENAVLYVMPVTVENSVASTELPGEIPELNLMSVTRNKNVGYYSLPVNGVQSINEAKSNAHPTDVSVYHRLTWEPAMGASGYKVYRSFDGVDYKRIGAVKTEGFEDYTYLIGKRVYYKVVPYNSYGDNEEGALTRFVVPLPALNVYLDSPQNASTDVNLAPTFSWHVGTSGGDFSESLYGTVYEYFKLSLFDATDYEIYWTGEEYEYEEGMDQFNYVLPFELNPGGVYSWDISYAEAYAFFEDDDTGWSYSRHLCRQRREEDTQLSDFL